MSGAVVRQARQGSARSARGVTLVELLVSLVLGLIVSGAALAVFITNRQTYLATQSLGRLQEGSRIAFELMSRDLREAAMMPCGAELSTGINNVVKGTDWWRDWSSGDRGFLGIAQDSGSIPFGTGAGERAAASAVYFDPADPAKTPWGDALELKAAVPVSVDPIVVKSAQTSASDAIQVNSTAGIAIGDLLLACDYGQSGERGATSAIFQASGIDAGAGTVAHGTAGGLVPGNDSASLLTGSLLQANGLVSEVHATRWFIAHDAHGGLSLYRAMLRNNGGTLEAPPEEIVRGIDGLDLAYLSKGAIAYSSAPASWANVVAVRVRMHITGADRIDGAPIERKIEHVVAIRSRAE